MAHFTPISAIFGGLLIGLSANLLLLVHGRIAGISGIVGGLLPPTNEEWRWRAVFLLGLVAGATLAYGLGASYGVVPPRSRTGLSAGWLMTAGLLVGVGTAMAHGCTSGHGVCGVARRSPRSLLATILFVLTGILVASFGRHVPGLP